MKIKVVVVDFELSRKAKRIGAAVVIFAVIVAGAAFSRASLTTPVHTFATGDVLNASDLNNNFGNLAGLDARITTLETIVHNPGSAYSSHANYCGITSAFDGQSVGGYAGAKTKCSAACQSSPTAHACTPAELVQSAALGMSSIPTTGSWVATGVYSEFDNQYGLTDCTGFTTNSSSVLGEIWQTGAPSVDFCNKSYPIACCD